MNNNAVISNSYIVILFFLLVLLNFLKETLAGPLQVSDALIFFREIQEAISLTDPSECDSARNHLMHRADIVLKEQNWDDYFLPQITMTRLLEKQGDLYDVVKVYIEPIRELEKERVIQGFQPKQKELDAEKKDHEIKYLQSHEEMQRLAQARREVEEKEQKKTNQLLEQQNRLNEQRLESTSQ